MKESKFKDKLESYFKGTLPIVLAAFLVGAPCIKEFENNKPRKEIIVDSMNLDKEIYPIQSQPIKPLDEKFLRQNNIYSLIKPLHESGYPVSNFLEDERFEFYKGIKNLFIRSPEERIKNVEEYKLRLGFEDKATKIPYFIEENFNVLEKAEGEYNIPKEIIASIIGIESDFGRNIGNKNPFNVYVSLYSEGHRKKFAKSQLEELLRYVERENKDVFELKSSYAGAMGFAQFIPYSLNKWFVGDISRMDDNIISVGNYLAYFNKKTGSIEKAVYRYNPSKLYTQTVLDLAEVAELGKSQNLSLGTGSN
ncbi:MAG: lytic murein transglycosylase [Candidatus Pacearchaeota archaeon]